MRHMTVRRMTGVAGGNDTARPREQAHNEHARDSLSTGHVVLVLRASGGVRRCGVADVANGMAQSGRRSFVTAIVQKTHEFLESAESSLVSARDCRCKCTTSM
jgi:hypothetical protein